MFHSRKLNTKINRLHEYCVRIVYSDKRSFFGELLETDNSFKMHHRNIQVLAPKLYKIVNRPSPKIMEKVFLFNENTTYDRRNKKKVSFEGYKIG